MIQYAQSRNDLEALIEAESPGWLARASLRTEKFRWKQRYEEASTIWSQIKPVYMRLQGHAKCAYCERKLESVDYGKVEQDVEHFRPKGNVRCWRAPTHLVEQGIACTPVPPAGQGYYLLSYHLFNYASACKPCNSTLKKDYFPIAGAYSLHGEDPSQLVAERPYLIYPIGDFDIPAEALIEFYGISPRPVLMAGHDRNRALVTITFFGLDDETKRKNLFRERAMLLLALFPLLEETKGAVPEAIRVEAQELVEKCLAPDMAHANCCRSFKRLYDTNPQEAREVYQSIRNFVRSMS